MGKIKIALAQLNYHIGDFGYNVSHILTAIEKAKSQQADVVVFAELSVCGYPPRDFLEFDDFIEQGKHAVATIASACQGIAAVVGAPSVNPAYRGKPLYNSAFFLCDGAIRAISHKTLLPNYDIFDEYRYFEPNRLPYTLVEHGGFRFALTICEDLWNLSDDPLYVRNPMDELIGLGPDLIINLAASPFHYHQPIDRREILARNAIAYQCPVVYVNHVGGQTELIFDGDSMVINARGELVSGLKRFKEDFQLFEFVRGSQTKGAPSPILESGKKEASVSGLPGTVSYLPDLNPLADQNRRLRPEPTIELIHKALVLGIRDYFGKLGFSQAILGLSGGIDSAVTLVLATEALGAKNVRALLLPSRFSSGHSIDDARTLAENLGVPYDIISIEEGFEAISRTLGPFFGGLPFNLAEENIQARLRSVILMALSNKFGYVLLNTSNKSEAAVGYGTLYGDMSGGLSVLGDLYKTQVYELARQINSAKAVIPMNSILKPPSAELRPGQKDSDSLPDYEILDQILFKYIEQRVGPETLIREGFDETTVKKVLKMVNTSEYKRHQSPPILRVSPKAFGMGRRMPIVARYLS